MDHFGALCPDCYADLSPTQREAFEMGYGVLSEHDAINAVGEVTP